MYSTMTTLALVVMVIVATSPAVRGHGDDHVELYNYACTDKVAAEVAPCECFRQVETGNATMRIQAHCGVDIAATDLWPAMTRLARLNRDYAVNYVKISVAKDATLLVPDDAFYGLTLDQKLQLYSDKGYRSGGLRLGHASFRGLTVHHLAVNGFGTFSLPDGALGNVRGLALVDLTMNRVATLSPLAFLGCTNVTYLSVGYNALQELPAGVFRHLPALEELQAGSNGMRRVAPGAFNGLASLRRLYLWYNELAHLDVDAFGDARALTTLDLSHNRFLRLEPDLLRPLAELTSLVLDHNDLETLATCQFAGNAGLRILELNNNHLAAMHVGVFADGKLPASMLMIYLADNPLACDCCIGYIQESGSIVKDKPTCVDPYTNAVFQLSESPLTCYSGQFCKKSCAM